jgi:hypothetical protein
VRACDVQLYKFTTGDFAVSFDAATGNPTISFGSTTGRTLIADTKLADWNSGSQTLTLTFSAEPEYNISVQTVDESGTPVAKSMNLISGVGVCGSGDQSTPLDGAREARNLLVNCSYTIERTKRSSAICHCMICALNFPNSR